MIVGAFNKEEINCAGFASIIKALVDKFDDPNLKCEIMPCEIRSKTIKKGSGHCQNLIYIKDSEYNIEGYYIEDSSNDSKPDSEAEALGYKYCLVPAGDMQHLKGNIIFKNFAQTDFKVYF